MRKKKKQDSSASPRISAFENIVNEYETPLLRYVTRIVSHHDVAENIVQETFIKLYKKWKDDLTPSPQLSSWLYRVAHNMTVDYMRKESRKQSLHKRHAEEKQTYAPPNRGGFFRISEPAANAAKALKKLSEREQQLVVLKVYEEKSYKEISNITGLTVSNVGYILHHAMKKMALLLSTETGNVNGKK